MKNWGGNVTFAADVIVRPTTVAQAQERIAEATTVRAMGSRHSFTHIADAPVIIDTTALPEIFEINAERTTVRVNGSMTYGRVAALLAPLGLALSNFASLPHISVAGAIATGTHGSGDANPNLAAMVGSVEVIVGTGEFVQFDRGDAEFGGAVVSLGALGLVTAVTLDVVPAFEVAQLVYDGGLIDDFVDNLDGIFSAGLSVSAFTRWRSIEQVWVKQRHGQATPQDSQRFLAGLTPAGEKRHPIRELDATGCTEQFGKPGPAAERLPHFRLDFNPSAGEEIQSEVFVDRAHAAEAIQAMAAIADDIAAALMVAEIRTVAADAQWMSPHVGRDSLAFHFTWVPNQQMADSAARSVAAALQPFEPRPHWGKVFDIAQFDLGQFPQRHRFLDLVDRVDPTGTFSNDWLNNTIR